MAYGGAAPRGLGFDTYMIQYELDGVWAPDQTSRLSLFLFIGCSCEADEGMIGHEVDGVI